jgi:hypothetical protein
MRIDREVNRRYGPSGTRSVTHVFKKQKERHTLHSRAEICTFSLDPARDVELNPSKGHN